MTNVQRSSMYSLAYSYPSKNKAGQAYEAARNLIYLHPCELSAYRILSDSGWHVLVVGLKPSVIVEEPLKKALKQFKGTLTTLPSEIVDMSFVRHFEKTKHTNWYEQSYDL